MSLLRIIPVRFLALTAHLTIIILLYWAREPNILACIPSTVGVGSSQFTTKDIQLLIGISLSLLFLVVEFIGFFSGLSMFTALYNLFSTAVHTAAAIALTVFITDVWSCDSFWYIFGFCSVPSLLIEVSVVLYTLKCKVFL